VPLLPEKTRGCTQARKSKKIVFDHRALCPLPAMLEKNTETSSCQKMKDTIGVNNGEMIRWKLYRWKNNTGNPAIFSSKDP
jgi:hypothetical protein